MIPHVPPTIWPVGDITMLAAFAPLPMLVNRAVGPPPDVVNVPLVVIVISPLGLVALLMTLIASKPDAPVTLPEPDTLIAPVLLDVALMPVALSELMLPLMAIAVLPVPPLMLVSMPAMGWARIGS